MRNLLILSALALGLFACEQDTESFAPPALTPPQEISAMDEVPADAQRVYDHLISVGYTPNQIVFNPDLRVAVVDDMGFDYDFQPNTDFNPNADLEAEDRKEPGVQGEKNRWLNYFVSWNQSRNIKYYVLTQNEDFRRPPSASYVNALRRAAIHWSWASNNINITRTYNRSEADFIFYSYYWPQRTDAWAVAGYPSGNSPYNVGSWMLINTAYAPTNSPYEQQVALMVHELGHTLGYGHSDVYEGEQISNSGSVTYHRNNVCGSVMRSRVYNCSCWNNNGGMFWNANDRRMVEYWYRYR